MNTTTVLICQGNTVFDLGIYNILHAAPGGFLLHTVPDDILQFLSAVETYHPDAVILSHRSQTARHSLFRNLLRTTPLFLLLTICTESNHIRINQNQIVQIQKASDLIDLIQNGVDLGFSGERMSMEQTETEEVHIYKFPNPNPKEENL